MDYSRIASLTFYTWDDALSRECAAHRFGFGGLTLHRLEEARELVARTAYRPPLASAARVLEDSELLVWTADPSEKIWPDTPPPGPWSRHARAAAVRAAGHEYATVAIVVRPRHDLDGVGAEATDLVCGAERIAAGNLALRYVDCVPGVLQDSPDPLPRLAGRSVAVRAGENLQLWATVYVPPLVPAGTYRGAIRLHARQGLRRELPIEVQVYGFSLAVETHLRSLFTVQHLYGGPEWLAERSERYWGRRLAPNTPGYFALLRNLVRDYGEHRLAPDLNAWFRFLSDDERLDLHRHYGIAPVFGCGYNLVNEYGSGESPGPIAPEVRARCRERWRQTAEALRGSGWADLAVAKIADEPSAAWMPAVQAAAEDLAAAMPDIQRFITIPSARLPESLFGWVDTWCPAWGSFDFGGPQALARKAAGERFWTYAGEYKANNAYAPVDIRVLFWLYWKYGISGTHYSHHVHSCFLTYPNDTYPHSDGLEQIPSIRWEMIRHGLQDYEYLWMLQDLVQRRGPAAASYRHLLEVPRELAVDALTYAAGPGPLLQRRHQIARAIEALCPEP
jgi:hypothetical protein